jgi:hypothetical protein
MTKKFFLIVFLCSVLGCERKKAGETTMMQKNHPTKAYCVGRSTMEFPVSFTPSRTVTGMFRPLGVSAPAPSFDVVVRDANITESKFAVEVEKRRLELEKSGSRGTLDVLRSTKTLPDHATLFRIQQVDDAYMSEIILLRGASVVTVQLESFHDQFLAAEESLINFASQIQQVNEHQQTSQQQGFCLGRVTVSGDFQYETGSYLFADGNGAGFSVEIDTYTPDEETPLLGRMSGSNSLLTIFDVDHKVLRARERMVAGMRAQEWLGSARLSEGKDTRTLKFSFETMRATPSKMAPSIDLTFNTAQQREDGSPTNTVITDEQAMQMWDLVVNSVRARGH